MEAPPGPHRRYNPLLDEWVLCSPQRLERPWQGQGERECARDRPRYDPSCYLCPGNRRANGATNPVYTSTFAFDNDFPALLPRAPAPTPSPEDDLLRARPTRGACRVLCFSPRHDLTLADMDVPGIRGVVDAWAEEWRRLSAHDVVAHLQVFENKGALMGCGNPHRPTFGGRRARIRATPRLLLPAPPALGHGQEVPGRLRDVRGAPARSHPGSRRRASARGEAAGPGTPGI